MAAPSRGSGSGAFQHGHEDVCAQGSQFVKRSAAGDGTLLPLPLLLLLIVSFHIVRF